MIARVMSGPDPASPVSMRVNESGSRHRYGHHRREQNWSSWQLVSQLPTWRYERCAQCRDADVRGSGKPRLV